MATNPTAIPLVQTEDRNINQLQSNIIPPLNTIIKNKIVNNNFLSGVQLINGTTVVNHLLDRKLVGWVITRQKSSAIIFDSQDTNPDQDVSLRLVSNAAVIVDIMVF